MKRQGVQNPLQTPLVKQEWVPPSGGLGGVLGLAEQPPPKQPLGVLLKEEQVSCCTHRGHAGVLRGAIKEPAARPFGSSGDHALTTTSEGEV